MPPLMLASGLTLALLWAPLGSLVDGGGTRSQLDPTDTAKALLQRAEELLHDDPREAALLLIEASEVTEDKLILGHIVFMDARRLEVERDPEAALARCREALAIARSGAFDRLYVRALASSVRLQRSMGDEVDALEAIAKLERLRFDLSDPGSLAEIAQLALEFGHYRVGMRYGALARSQFAADGEWELATEMNCELGNSFLEVGDATSGRRLLWDARQDYRRSVPDGEVRPLAEARVYRLLAQADRNMGRMREARLHLSIAQELAAAHGPSLERDSVTLETAEMALHDEEYERVLQLLEPLEAGLDRNKDDFRVRARRLEGRARLGLGQTERAIELAALMEPELSTLIPPAERLAAKRYLVAAARAKGDQASVVAHLEDIDSEIRDMHVRMNLPSLARSDERRRSLEFADKSVQRRESELSGAFAAREADAASDESRLAVGLVTIAVGLLLASLYALRLRRRSNELAGIAAESSSRQRDAETTLAFISHDLRGPLTTIRAATDLLQLDLPKDQRRLLTLIENGSQRMEKILEAMLALMQYKSQADETSHELIGLRELVEGVVDEARAFAKAKRVTLRIETPDEPVMLRTEPVLFRQIVQNLVSNAVKFSPADQEVLVRIERNATGGARLAVVDRGPGIPLEDRQQLWSLFGRTSAEPTGGESSTGVGLALAKSIAEALGCTIGVDGGLDGRGATFRLEFERLLVDEGHRTVLVPRPPRAEARQPTG
ncbi:MAG: HAMP domain-containing sensor histidine kinase [Planctomycetota bacterium]